MPPNPLKRDSSNISISFPRFIFFFNTFKILTNKSFNVRDKLICTLYNHFLHIYKIKTKARVAQT